MKLLDWISRKPEKDQQEPRSNADSSQKHSKNSIFRAAAAVQVKLQQNQKNRFDLRLYKEEEVKKMHEIVKIFANHEEYGLLSIGTLGLYGFTSGVEPEIELFNGLVTQDGGKRADEESYVDTHKEEDESNSKSDKALIIHKQAGSNVKKLFLDPHVSKRADRLLHPLSYYLNPGSIRRSFRDYISPCLYPSQKRKQTTGNEVSLFKGTRLRESSNIKQKNEDIDGSCSPSRMNRKRRSKFKKAVTQFSCKDDSEYDADDEYQT